MTPAPLIAPIGLLAAAGAGAVVGLLLTPIAVAHLRTRRPGFVRVALLDAICTSVLVVLAVARHGFGLALVPYLWLAIVCGALASVDLIEHRLPDRLVLAATAGFAVLLVADAVLSARWTPLAGAGIGGAALLAVYLVLAMLPGARIGGGDVKLAFVLGAATAATGLRAWLICLVGAFLLSAVVSLVLLALRRVRLSSAIALGPWMIAAAFLGVALT